MIRRHFLGGLVGIKAMVAAAALAFGAGQPAQSATYDVMFTITKAEHIYSPLDQVGGGITPLSEWWGMAVNTSLRGVLEYGENIFPVLTVGGSRLFGEWGYAWQDPPGTWIEQNFAWNYNYLTWTGSEGTWLRWEDSEPDYYRIEGEFRLAPVPLPATAALLPLGIGALALMRRRRRLS